MKISEASSVSTSDGSAPVKCIACGYGNSATDASCQACGSSLDLKLCSACEAINAMKAERCHACGAQFMAPVGNSMVPVAMTYTVDTPRRSGRRALALLIVLVFAAAVALAYRYYGDLLAPSLHAMFAVLNVQVPAPAAQRAAQVGPSLAGPAVVVQAPAKRTSAKEAPKATGAKEAARLAAAERPADPGPVSRANRAVVSSRAPASGATVMGGAYESAKQGSPVVGVSASLPEVQMVHSHVTHTKVMPNDATLPVASVVARPATGSKRCSEAIAALGLCASNEKGEGKSQ